MKSKLVLTILTVLTLILTMAGTAGIASAGTGCDPAYVQRSGNVIVVQPNGVNDTANLQCAFDTALTVGTGAEVRLSAGVFHTAQVVVNGFDGLFTGAGADTTVINNLPTLQVTPVDFYIEAPSTNNPWPSLFAFIGGDFAITDLAVQIRGATPTTGWTVWGIDPPIKELCHAVVILGTDTHVRVERIRLEGQRIESSAYGYNLLNGLIFMGFLGQIPWPPIAGSFQVSDSIFREISASTPVSNISNATVIISHNSYEDTTLAMDASDVKNSYVEFSHNKIVEAVIGFDLWDYVASEYVGSTFLVKNNIFDGAIGIAFEQTFGEGNKCLLQGNNVQNVTDIGIYLGPGTTGCTVVGGKNKTNVLDLGTGNILVGVNNMGTGVGPIIRDFLRMKKP